MREYWERIKLSEVLRHVRRNVVVESGGRYQLLGMRWYGEGPFPRETVIGGEAKASRYFRVESGDFIYNRLFAWKGSFGIIPPALAGSYVSGEFPTFIADPNRLLPEYLQLVMCRPQVWSQIERESTGSTATSRNRWKEERFLSFDVELPPLAEQRRIVDLVGSADEVMHQLTMTFRSVGHAATSVRFRAFDEDAVRVVQLGDLCGEGGIQIGPFGSQLHASDYVRNGIPSVMPQDIVDRQIRTSSIKRVSQSDWRRLARHQLREGDIVLPRRGDLTKRALVTSREEGWLCGTGTVRVRVTGADPRVVFEALSTAAVDRWLADHAVGITMPNLNTEIVSQIPVRLPEESDAREIVELLGALSDYRSALSDAEQQSRAARTALISDLLSGEHQIPESYDALLESA